MLWQSLSEPESNAVRRPRELTRIPLAVIGEDQSIGKFTIVLLYRHARKEVIIEQNAHIGR